MSTVLVTITGNQVKRYAGRNLTHHAKTNRDLTREEAEAFRTAPDEIMGEPDPEPEPRAA